MSQSWFQQDFIGPRCNFEDVIEKLDAVKVEVILRTGFPGANDFHGFEALTNLVNIAATEKRKIEDIRIMVFNVQEIRKQTASDRPDQTILDVYSNQTL